MSAKTTLNYMERALARVRVEEGFNDDLERKNEGAEVAGQAAACDGLVERRAPIPLPRLEITLDLLEAVLDSAEVCFSLGIHGSLSIALDGSADGSSGPVQAMASCERSHQ